MDDAADDADPADPRLREALVADLDAGFADVVGTYQDLVYSLALRSTTHRGDAEDLASESFLRAYRALRGYGAARITELAVRPWLVTIVLNTARNRVRTRERRPATSDAPLPDRADAGPGVEDRVVAAEQQQELGAHLATLPPKQRDAVVLRHVVDLPVAEVAAVLGCNENTARSHAARGLARLRALMETHTRADGTENALEGTTA